MPARRHLVAFVLLAQSLAAAACSLGAARSDEKKDDAGAPAAHASGPETGEGDGETSKSDIPVPVSGSFLTLSCSDEDALQAGATAGEVIVGCIIKDGDQRYAGGVNAVELSITLADGTVVRPPLAVPPEGAPWHILLQVEPAVVQALKTLTVTFAREDTQEKVTLSTTNFDYLCASDPLCSALSTVAKILYDSTFAAPPPDPLPPLPPGFAHVVFLTDEYFRGDLGEAEADAACERAGKIYDPARRFVAVISTKARPAKERIKLTGPVANPRGYYLSAAEEFFTALHKAPIGRTVTNQDVTKPVAGATTLLWVKYAWTGTDPAGNLSAQGNCADWTSAADAAFGASGWGSQWDANWIERTPPLSCAQYGRLICINQ